MLFNFILMIVVIHQGDKLAHAINKNYQIA